MLQKLCTTIQYTLDGIALKVGQLLTASELKLVHLRVGETFVNLHDMKYVHDSQLSWMLWYSE